ncbi:MAG TPA: ABC transporter permease [Tepidisphaeraceae bacterium]|jgi:putative ABC transport system permease protein
MLNFLAETFGLGLRNLYLHKLRSLLTALGIILGVAAVIAMVAIGEGTKQAALEQLRQLGARNIIIRSAKPPESSDTGARTQRVLDFGVKRADLLRLKALTDPGTNPRAAVMVPLRDTEQKVVRGDVRVAANAIGTTSAAFDVINLRLERGRYFTPVDEEHQTPVCVIGSTAAKQLFPYQDPIGETIQIGSGDLSVVILQVVGVLEPTGLRAEGAAMINRNLDQDIYFPLSLAQSRFGDSIIRRQAGSFERKNIELSEVWMQAERTEDVERLASNAENIMQATHRNSDFEVKAPIQILRSAEKVQQQFNIVLGTIAGFSLVVGGIGIMNIMLASVTERTREIGIRRALGAKRKHITLQFLIETSVISLTGGLIGIALGSGLSVLLPVMMPNYRTNIATWSVIGSFVASGMIGIVFGMYPAIMAARMNPIEALRHE